MAKKKKQVIKSKPLTREDVYQGEVPCPICQMRGILRMVSTYRVGCFLQSNPKHSDYEGVCPICRK